MLFLFFMSVKFTLQPNYKMALIKSFFNRWYEVKVVRTRTKEEKYKTSGTSAIKQLYIIKLIMVCSLSFYLIKNKK